MHEEHLMPPASPAQADLRDLRRDLDTVTDAQLRQVVALIDGMDERGRMDELIAPLRERIAHLRPPRPLQFTRLLFLPLDPVIVPPPAYRPGAPAIPRSVLLPLSALVRAGLGRTAGEIEAAIRDRPTTDTAAVQSAGEVVWPAAARILRAAPAPADWADTGLAPTLYPSLATAIATVLEQAPALYAVVLDAAAGLPVEPEALDGFLQRVAPAGPDALGLMLATMVGALPAPDAVLRRADEWTRRARDPALRAVVEPVLDAQLTSLETRDAMTDDMLAADLTTVSNEVRRITTLLEGLSSETSTSARRARLETIRQRLDASCQTRFADGLAQDLLAPLEALRDHPDPASTPRLEEAARRLRALETEARRLGGASTYDRLLRQTTAAVCKVAAEAGLARADKVRLVEILAGPEAALPLLRA
jgi:hypothetical protein